MALSLLAAFTLLPHLHLYLDRRSTKTFLNRWKPNVIGNHLLTVRDVNAYVSAIIMLQEKKADGAIINTQEDCFLCQMNSSQTFIVAVVWRKVEEADRIESMERLRHWHHSKLPDSVITPKGLAATDLQLWKRSF